MTVIGINDGRVKSISILTAGIHPMMESDVDTLPDCFRLEVQWTLAIH